MLKDCEFVRNYCMTCLHFEKSKKNEHLAISIPVHDLHDRIGIDLVFGLPLTSEGYKGIMVITEYLSKFPYAVPIKSKSANEIAQALFTYIAIFGPPKELLSDQGREFLNNIVEKMLKISGIEHRVTSAYHPRTNGLTERFNQTMVKALSKHAEITKKTGIYGFPTPYWLTAAESKAHQSSRHSSSCLDDQ